VNVSAVRNGLARLPQSQGIPADEKTKIENMFQKYLDRYNEEKESDMNLQEFLASNPVAQNEYNQNIQKANADGIEAGKKEIQAKVDKVLPFLANEDYFGIDALAKKVLSGESDIAALDGAIAAFDMMKAKGEIKDAIDDSGKAGDIIPSGNTGLSQDGVIRNEADLKAFEQRSGKGGA
jgi:hypothetical protein